MLRMCLNLDKRYELIMPIMIIIYDYNELLQPLFSCELSVLDKTETWGYCALMRSKI